MHVIITCFQAISSTCQIPAAAPTDLLSSCYLPGDALYGLWTITSLDENLLDLEKSQDVTPEITASLQQLIAWQ